MFLQGSNPRQFCVTERRYHQTNLTQALKETDRLLRKICRFMLMCKGVTTIFHLLLCIRVGVGVRVKAGVKVRVRVRNLVTLK